MLLAIFQIGRSCCSPAPPNCPSCEFQSSVAEAKKIGTKQLRPLGNGWRVALCCACRLPQDFWRNATSQSAGVVEKDEPCDLSLEEFLEETVSQMFWVAGCSVVKDLSDMVGREQVFTDEVCFSYSLKGNYENTVVMVREPRDHVYSMYQFCHLASDPGYRLLVGERQGLKGQEKYNLAESFDAWINEWHENPRWGDYDIYDDDEFCYCPYNMQSSRLACNSKTTAKYCHKNADFAIAMKNLESASIIGVVEAYHESVCLFSARLTGSLPEHCDCESASWNAYLETHVSHREDAADEAYGSIKDVPKDVIHKVDDMTKEDRILYQAAVRRFTTDIKEVELRFGKRILCDSPLQRLQNVY
eukprot:s1421_g11.t2